MTDDTNKNQIKIDYLKAQQADIRDEIKKRIEQRDKYSVQLTISLAAVVAFAFRSTGTAGGTSSSSEVLVVVPMICIYFTVLILYSYHIHGHLARYLREEIEPKLTELCGMPKDIGWENYCEKNKIVGIRHSFFFLMLYLISFASMAYLWIVKIRKPDLSMIFTAFFTLIYIGVLLWIWFRFKKRKTT